MVNKKSISVALIFGVLILGWLVYRDSIWTQERVLKSAEIEIGEVCRRWKTDRKLFVNRNATKEEGNAWMVNFTNAKGDLWVKIAFNRLGGVDSFTNLDPTIADLEKGLKDGTLGSP